MASWRRITLDKDCPKESKEGFARRHAKGTTVTMLQKEFGLSKPSTKNWRERAGEGSVDATGRPRNNKKRGQEFKAAVVEAFIEGKGDCRELARRFGVRNGSQTTDWASMHLEGRSGRALQEQTGE